AGADLYEHEMPGGQYTNLFQQARALGLADRWSEVCKVYADVNRILGDIVKVTPTSKAVGDLALFLIANDMSADEVLSGTRELAYPQSVIELVSGRMVQTPGGFPKKVRDRILKGEKPLRGRPGASLPAADFEKTSKTIRPLLNREPTQRDIVSHLLYPEVFQDFAKHQKLYGDTSHLPTPVFFSGLEPGEEIAVDIETGKTLIIRFLTIGEPHDDGRRTVFFELNGQPREVTVVDQGFEPDAPLHVKADSTNPGHVGASMPGMVVNVAVQVGDSVVKGQKLLMLEAMKMQTLIAAEVAGEVKEVHVHPGTHVETGDLLVVIEES
ncbi:MAG: biotin/lipoyl-binding protein, partial [Planctomycetaceae bacterium]|nr:biotin/lipoyl-binding protein [Planctomycetaceae bacterium]